MKQVSKVTALSQVAKSLANTEPVKQAISINDSEGSLIIEFTQVANQASNKNQQLAELLYANGKRSYHFVGANDEDKSLVAFRNQVIGYIVRGFDKEAQKLYSAEPKSLNMTKQVERTVLTTKTIPTLFGNIKKAMVRLEGNIASGKGEKAKPKTQEQMVKMYVKKAIESIGKCKNGYEGMLKDKQTLEALAVLKQVK